MIRSVNRYLFVFLFLFVFAFGARAQFSVGLRAGSNFSNLSVEDHEDRVFNTKTGGQLQVGMLVPVIR